MSRFAIRNPHVVIVVCLVLAMVGVTSLSRMPVDLFPPIVMQSGQALDLAQSRYDLGLSSIVEFNQAQLARTSAEIQYANAKYDYQMQRAVLQYQVGR